MLLNKQQNKRQSCKTKKKKETLRIGEAMRDTGHDTRVLEEDTSLVRASKTKIDAQPRVLKILGTEGVKFREGLGFFFKLRN